MTTTNDDIIGSQGGRGSASTPAPRAKGVFRKRFSAKVSAKRTRGLLSVVLRKPKPQATTVMVCPSCELTGGPFAPGEAAHLLAVHDQMHHGGLSLHRPALPPAS